MPRFYCYCEGHNLIEIGGKPGAARALTLSMNFDSFLVSLVVLGWSLCSQTCLFSRCPIVWFTLLYCIRIAFIFIIFAVSKRGWCEGDRSEHTEWYSDAHSSRSKLFKVVITYGVAQMLFQAGNSSDSRMVELKKNLAQSSTYAMDQSDSQQCSGAVYSVGCSVPNSYVGPLECKMTRIWLGYIFVTRLCMSTPDEWNDFHGILTQNKCSYIDRLSSPCVYIICDREYHTTVAVPLSTTLDG